MKICNNCGCENPPDAEICENCGYTFFELEGTAEDTFVLSKAEMRNILSQTRWGDKDFEEGSSLKLQHGDTSTIFAFSHAVTVGRPLSPETPRDPFMDHIPLNVTDAVQHGVSRKHIQITRENNRVWVTDLESDNGTRLNGYPVTPGQKRLLRDGDELYLGNLRIQVIFLHGE
ncbi:MAG: FHA domain-containing protein [Anaerolineae bacterium]|jgi:pSer/pThr/pTyr-binding forkhead associated (FHA) protein|nr:FHA domain-containing protein [Anaerolineae bacterium]